MSHGLKMVLFITVLGGALMPAPAAAQARSQRGAAAYCGNIIGGIFSADPSELSAFPNSMEGWYCAGLEMPLIGLPEGFDRFARFCSVEKGFGVLVTYTDLYGIMPVFMCLTNVVTPTLSPAAFNAERSPGDAFFASWSGNR